jgi:toxic protein SymE
MKTYAPVHIEFFPDLPPAPWIRLSGRWLEEAGFEISGRIRVEVERGRLVITPMLDANLRWPQHCHGY